MQITSFYCRIIARALHQQGSDTSSIFKDTGLTQAHIDQVSAVHIDQFTTFLNNALAVSEAPAFGFVVGEQTRLVGFGEIGVAALSAPTILEGLQVMETYGHLHSGLSTTQLRAKSQDLQINVVHYRDDGYNTIYSEVFALAYQNLLEEIMGTNLEGTHFQFSYPEPIYAELYHQKLHGSIEFGCPLTSMTIPQEIALTRSPYHDPRLWRRSLQQCAEELGQLADDTTGSFSTHIMRILRSSHLPLPKLSSMSSNLCLSERTLSRRLNSEGTSYRQLLNAEMEDRAREYVANSSLSIEAIAAELGYEDPANFRRAFKSWVKQSPLEFRTEFSST